MKARLLIVFLVFAVSACGFHLRGSQQSSFDIANIYLSSSNAPQLTRQVMDRMKGAGVTIASSPDSAAYVLTLKQENFEKSVLSVAADTGKVEEFLITYTATMDARTGDGEPLLKDDPITLARDFTFDETSVLGEFSEEQLLREDLVVRASSQVLRRLQAVISEKR